MNQEQSKRLILAIVILACVGVGAVLYSQSQRVDQGAPVVPEQEVQTQGESPVVTGAMPSAPAQGMPGSPGAMNPDTSTSSQVTVPVMVGEEIAVRNLGTAASAVNVSHRCIDGKVTVNKSNWNGETYRFCVGRNQLVIQENGRDVLVDDRLVMAAPEAPILIKVEPIGDTVQDQSPQILISYSPEPCTTTDDCGVGMPTSHVTFVYSLATHKPRRLWSFPQFTSGSATWNASFTKALFFPLTCGGAGCTPSELIGYNLQTDFVTQAATTERAASGTEAAEGAGALTDVRGNRLPYWSQIEWTSESQFRASITEPSNRTRIVKGEL